jgi:hypothetical protein
MSLVGMSSAICRCLVALVAAATLPVLCHAASAADAKRSAQPSAVKAAPEPSGSELVGKLLQDGPSDPDVPLPQRGLGRSQDPASTPLHGPQIFGRQEDGGGVVGLRIPISPRTGAF